jgi:ABC-2 type transport system permease protein
MLAVFLRTLKSRRLTIIIYTAVGVLFLWMYVGMFPSFSNKTEEFNQLMQAYPESFMKAFGIEDATKIFSNIENFLAMENYSFLWPILAVALVVSVAGFSIAGEVEKKTIETLLAQPISRAKLFWGKYLAGVAIIAAFSILSIFAVIPLCKIHGVSYNTGAHFKMLIIGILFCWAIYSLTSLFSAISSERARPYFISVGILVVMYAIKIVASLKENLENLKYFSFFHYLDAAKILGRNELDYYAIIVFALVIVVSTIFAQIVFEQRDITVS